MKKYRQVFFSMTTTVILLLTFGLSIGIATFAESSKGTQYAKDIIYNTGWFEMLLLLLIINLIGSVFYYNIFNKKKFSVLLFHFSFILILAGAGITRYTGEEGILHLREGESSNQILSEKTGVVIHATDGKTHSEKTIQVHFGVTETNHLKTELNIGSRKIDVEAEQYFPNAEETLIEDELGQPHISLFLMNKFNQGIDINLAEGECYTFEGSKISFGQSTTSDLRITLTNNSIYINASDTLHLHEMMEESVVTDIPSNQNVDFQARTIYQFKDIVLVLKSFHPKASRILSTASTSNTQQEAIRFRISENDIVKQVHVFSHENEYPQEASCNINGINVKLAYGNYPIHLPFSIQLKKFEIERYPGSNSPSSFASEITVIDSVNKLFTPYRIYMNNILNYNGYRFFQSSYDEDEQGTILSVNHDYWGTLVTYAGYCLMLIGMILTLFNKNSRFHHVLRLSNALREKQAIRKTLFFIAFLGFTQGMSASNPDTSKSNHLEELSSLLIQDDIQGRIEPFSTYASDLIRKISKKETYKDYSAIEVILNMIVNPNRWQYEPLIKVSHNELAKELGAVNEYISFAQLYDSQNKYRIEDQVQAAYLKDPALRNMYDKEIINLDERINICNRILTGEILTVIPDKNGKWTSPVSLADNYESEANKQASCPIHEGTMSNSTDGCPGNMSACPMDETINSTIEPTVQHANNTVSEAMLIFSEYMDAVILGYKTNNWNEAKVLLSKLKEYQVKSGGSFLPSKTKIRAEIIYNQLSIFLTLAILHGIIGVILIAVHLINILRFNPKIEKYLHWSKYPLLLIFLAYTGGLILRWYISGHAPWSNGYESMLFVGWATSLSGLIFANRSPISLAITSLLTAISLAVAGMSWMNPEITNLVPVLKSYWLVIHVAIITSSYGFFGLSALLGLFNLFLMSIRKKSNATMLNEKVQEYSYIIELAMTIGLFMLTVGTFIGGVWANESWGRYWGWDAKETWALVSILVYAAIIHLRKIPRCNNQLVFNTTATMGFSTIIMTYLGVNYYLSGMHSYGQGTPPPLPGSLYATLLLFVILVILAYHSERKLKLLK